MACSTDGADHRRWRNCPVLNPRRRWESKPDLTLRDQKIVVPTYGVGVEVVGRGIQVVLCLYLVLSTQNHLTEVFLSIEIRKSPRRTLHRTRGNLARSRASRRSMRWRDERGLRQWTRCVNAWPHNCIKQRLHDNSPMGPLVVSNALLASARPAVSFKT